MQTISDALSQYAQGKPGAAEYKQKGPACITCFDVGFIRGNFEPGHPMFGKVLPCPDCSMAAPVLSEPDEYGLLPADRALVWQSVVSGLDSSIDRAVAAVKTMLARGYGWVYLWGGYGTAKTTILKIAVAEALRSGEFAVYLSMADMMDSIREAYDLKSPQAEAARKIRWFSTLPVLAIDELEKTKSTEFVDERRFQILNARYEAATRQAYGVTLLAANVPPGDLPGALASRVGDGRFAVVHITAKDMRPLGGEF